MGGMGAELSGAACAVGGAVGSGTSMIGNALISAEEGGVVATSTGVGIAGAGGDTKCTAVVVGIWVVDGVSSRGYG